jgi:hypothetical protein
VRHDIAPIFTAIQGRHHIRYTEPTGDGETRINGSDGQTLEVFNSSGDNFNKHSL